MYRRKSEFKNPQVIMNSIHSGVCGEWICYHVGHLGEDTCISDNETPENKELRNLRSLIQKEYDFGRVLLAQKKEGSQYKYYAIVKHPPLIEHYYFRKEQYSEWCGK